jgi:hypothetical protein
MPAGFARKTVEIGGRLVYTPGQSGVGPSSHVNTNGKLGILKDVGTF